MTFKISEVSSAAEFDEIWPVHFLAFRNPYNTLSKFFNPVHTTMEAAIEASKARHIKVWEGNEGCHWISVTDTSSGRIVGAACWIFHLETQTASPNKAPFNAYWHIEGSDEKAFAEKLIGGIRAFVSDRATQPHIELSQMMVSPDFRNQGIGSMLVAWGTQKASDHGVDTIIVSVPYAEPFYEKCGFDMVEQINIDFTVADPSEKWKEYEAEDLRTFFMHKPAQSIAGAK